MQVVTRQLACAVKPSRGSFRRASRLALAALLLSAAGLLPGGGTAQSTPATEAGPAGAVANLRTEVRLRKLHLVRPDLIQYPLAYDIIC